MDTNQRDFLSYYLYRFTMMKIENLRFFIFNKGHQSVETYLSKLKEEMSILQS